MWCSRVAATLAFHCVRVKGLPGTPSDGYDRRWCTVDSGRMPLAVLTNHRSAHASPCSAVYAKQMKLITDYQRGAFWIAIIAIFVSAILSWLTSQNDIQIARDSGQFRRPRLAVSLRNLPIAPATSTDILFGARDLATPNAVMIAGLPMLLTNNGDATLDDLTVTFRYHKLFQRDVLEGLSYKTSGSADVDAIKHTFNEDGEFQYSSYFVPALHPKVSIQLEEPIYLRRTPISIEVPLQSGDHQRPKAKVHVDYAIQVLLSVAARDTAAANYTLNVSAVQADSFDGLVDIAGNTRIATRMWSLRATATLPEYLRALIFGVPEEKLNLVFPEFDSRPAGEGRLYNARPDPKTQRLSYRPVSWRHLFGKD